MKNKILSISVCSSFTAAHRHDKSLLENLHSHNFKYKVTLKGPLNDEGFVVDFRKLEESLKELNASFEGKTLNEILRYPTTENLAIYIFEKVAAKYPQTSKVEIEEKEGCSACYEK